MINLSITDNKITRSRKIADSVGDFCCLLVCLLYFGDTFCQNPKQYIFGTITELNTGKRPIYPVQISSDLSASIVNKSDGSFRLDIVNIAPGEKIKIYVSYINPKTNEEWKVINEYESDIIIRNHTDSQRVHFYMCSPKKIDDQTLLYYRGIEKNINREYEAKIRKLRRDNADYQAKLNQLTFEKDRALETAKDYARKYASTEIADMTKAQQKALSFIKQGNFDSALQVLGKENAEHEALQTKKDINRQKEIQDVAETNRRELEKKLSSQIKTVIQTAELYELQNRDDLAEKGYINAMLLDSTHPVAFLQYANLKIRKREIAEGRNLLKFCLTISSLAVDSFFAYSNLGVSHEIYHEYDSAFLYFNFARNLFLNSKSGFRHTDSISAAGICFEQAYLLLENGDSVSWKQTLSQANDILGSLDKNDSSADIKALKVMQLSIKGDYEMMVRKDLSHAEGFYISALFFAEQAKSKLSKIHRNNSRFLLAKTFKRLAMLRERQNVVYEAEQYYLKAIATLDTLCLFDPLDYELETVNNYQSLAGIFLTSNAAKSNYYFKQSLKHYYNFSKFSLQQNKETIGVLFFQIGNSGVANKNDSNVIESVNYLDSSIMLFEGDPNLQHAYSGSIALASFQIGQFFLFKNGCREAQKYMLKTIHYLDSMQKRSTEQHIMLMNSHHNMGYCLKNETKSDSVAIYFRRALELSDSSILPYKSRDYGVGTNSAELALFYSETDRVKAEEFKRKAIPLLINYPDDDYAKTLYLALTSTR